MEAGVFQCETRNQISLGFHQEFRNVSCPFCGGEGEVWAEEPRWSPRILLDEVAAEMWAEEDAP